MNENSFFKILVWILRLSVFSVFIGRGFDHLFWDAPFRVVLWDQSLMEGFINKVTGMTWHEYATSSTVDFIINLSVKAVGLFFILCSFLALFISIHQKKFGKLLLVGMCFLIILSLLFYKNKFYKFGQFIEYSCQMFSPLFLYILLFYRLNIKQFNLLLKIAIALTFIGHGLYALGIYVTPGVWIDMATSSLDFIGIRASEHAVEQIIFIAGILDMVLAVGIFLPKKWAAPFLIWAAIWGLLTSLSRVIGYMNFDPSWHTFFQWLPKTIMRMPHALIPIAALLITCFSYSGYNKLEQQNLKISDAEVSKA